jgi:hypothetical protein
MSFKIARKAFKIGGSRAVMLPASWYAYYGERARSLTIYEDGVLIIAPVGLERKAEAMIEQYQSKNEGGNGNG